MATRINADESAVSGFSAWGVLVCEDFQVLGAHVARLTQLARDGFYNGVPFV
jgi:hypothetical protein